VQPSAPSFSLDRSEGDSKFPEQPSYRDPLWLVLFVIHIIGVIVLCGFGTAKFLSGGDQAYYVDITSDSFRHLLTVTLICIAVAAGISVVWLQIVKHFARQLIIGTFIASVILWSFFGLWLLVQGSLAGIFMVLMAGLFAMFYFWWRNRIPFATAMLEAVSERMQEFPGTIYAGYIMILITVVWNVFFGWTLSVSQHYSDSITNLLIAFYVLSYYWTTQVIKNVLHVTVSGTFATWYFMSSIMPSNPTIKSLKRSLTTSFGSICFGSLLVALLETLRTFIQAIRRQQDNLVAFCADCLIGLLDGLLQYFNIYAFTQVAIYGKSYIQAAKDSWQLVHTHGIEAIINDNLISNVLTIGALIGGVTCGIVGAIVGNIIEPDFLASCALIGFIVGFAMMTTVMSVVQSGVSTFFVCFAMDKEALQRNNPELYRRFMETYFV